MVLKKEPTLNLLSMVCSMLSLVSLTFYCVPLIDEVFNEDVLEEHEKEIIRLESLLCSMAPILKLIERRNGILAEKEEFEQSSKDPNRLLTKKSSRDPGRLLREEKMRKTIEKELPKLQEKLKDLITEWEDANNEYFIYNGSRYLQSLLQLEQTSQHQDSSLKVGKSTMPTPKKVGLRMHSFYPRLRSTAYSNHIQ